MDSKVEIQLGSTRNVNAVNVDSYSKIALNRNSNELLEYNINNILSVTEIFETERQNTEIYRIYGGLEYFSLLNGLKKAYKYLSDFFNPGKCNFGNETCQYKDIYSSFDFYLVRPSRRYKITLDSITYGRDFEVVATPDDFDLFEAGYSKNIFGDQKYIFIFNKDFDITGIVDSFGFPIMDLYIYAVYKPSLNGFNTNDQLYRTGWNANDGEELRVPLTGTKTYDIGDRIIGDVIEFSQLSYQQIQIKEQIHYIRTPYIINYNDGIVKYLEWKFNPLIPLPLRVFSNEVSRANTGGTSYDQTSSIPYYALNVGNGNMVWRNILEQGYIDPLTGDGVDYPFINKRRYLFDNLILSVIPNTDDSNTANVFKEIQFGQPTLLFNSPSDDISKIGKPC